MSRIKLKAENQGINAIIFGESIDSETSRFFRCMIQLNGENAFIFEDYSYTTLMAEFDAFCNAESEKEAVVSSLIIFKGYVNYLCRKHYFSLYNLLQELNYKLTETEKRYITGIPWFEDDDVNMTQFIQYIVKICPLMTYEALLNADTGFYMDELVKETIEYDLNEIRDY